MTRDPAREHPALWSQPPLPGVASCLTLQLNATYYRAGATTRWVCILRDPDANQEIHRLVGAARPDDQAALEELFAQLGSMIELADYHLYGTVDTLKQALAEDPPPPGASPSTTKRRATPTKA